MSLSVEPEIDREVTGASFKKPLNLARRRLFCDKESVAS
jgi:hypothetical protein